MKTLLFIAKIICAQFLLSLFIVSCDKETETPENPPENPHFDETKLRLNVSDSLAMVNIYKAMGPWSVEWDLTDRHTWNGVETMLDLDKNELRITGFESYGGRYKNTISEEFRKLTELRKLAIPGGTLSGNIPSWIGELTKLELLVLGDNYLNGEIPPEIGNLRQLQVLKITNCDIEGSIPETLGNLSNLVYLHLYGNKLSGEIPKSLKNLPKLDLLYLNGNQLSGRFPIEILNKPQMNVNCRDNNITELPFEVWEDDFVGPPPFLSGNRLSGEVPDSVLMLDRWKEYYDVCVTNQQEGYGYSNIEE